MKFGKLNKLKEQGQGAALETVSKVKSIPDIKVLGFTVRFWFLFVFLFTTISTWTYYSVLLGVRLQEFGRAGDLRGATVTITGVCEQDGIRRDPLSEDQVKISAVVGTKVHGVIRATREAVVCDSSQVSIEPLPLSYLLKTKEQPIAVPAIAASKPKIEKPSIKDELKNKMVRFSGTCTDAAGKEESYSDRVMDITDVRVESEDSYVILGALKGTGKVINCRSGYIRSTVITEYVPPSEITQETLNYKGKVVIINGTCFPASYYSQNNIKKLQSGDDVPLFVDLVDARVKVLEHNLVDGEVRYLKGAALDKGFTIECSKERYSFDVRPYDPGTMTIRPVQPNQNSEK
nr:hypothetical protein BdHM001_35150 [Bdellovibrio sp. HM001]